MAIMATMECCLLRNVTMHGLLSEPKITFEYWLVIVSGSYPILTGH